MDDGADFMSWLDFGALRWRFAAWLCPAGCLRWSAASCARRSPTPHAMPPVTILKPLHLGEPGLSAKSGKLLRPGLSRRRSRSCSACMTKPIPPSRWCKALQARYPQLRHHHRRRQRAVWRQRQGLQSDQHAARRQARHAGAVATATSRVPRDWLAQVTGALAQPGVGLVTCLYTGEAGQGGTAVVDAWRRWARPMISCPMWCWAPRLGLAEPCMGSTIALDPRRAGRDRRLCRFRRLSGR